MNKNTIRLDVIAAVPEEQMVKRLQDALEPFDKYLISYEVGNQTGKPHYQGIIFTDMPYETYRKHFEKLFVEWKGGHGKKNGCRSFAPVRDDNYEIYVTKGGDYRFVKGYTDDEIASLYEKSYTVDKTELKQASKNKKNVKQDDAKRKNWFDTLIEHCKNNGVDASSNGWEIAKWIIDAYREYVKCEPNDFQIKCYAKSIQRQLVYEYSVTQNKQRVYERYLERRAKDVIGHEWVHVQLD